MSTATNVAQARRKQRGVSGSAHAHLSGRKQFVLKCDWTAAACTWKWMTAALLTRPHTSPALADWQRIDHAKLRLNQRLERCELIAHRRGSSVATVLMRVVYSSFMAKLICTTFAPHTHTCKLYPVIQIFSLCPSASKWIRAPIPCSEVVFAVLCVFVSELKVKPQCDFDKVISWIRLAVWHRSALFGHIQHFFLMKSE